MIKFIYICMTCIILSFLLIPAINGISKEYEILNRPSQVAKADPVNELSFDEIYRLTAQQDQEVVITPQFLNNIVPAAGGENEEIIVEDSFSSPFESKQHPAF